MPRANRHFLPGHIWHITHRCHKQEFLLKFARDRRLWRYWLYQARRRYGLCVLNYIATSNHIHLLVRDQGRGEIPLAMQLVAGRVGRAFNQRKGRKGAFWEDRYHATAVEAGAPVKSPSFPLFQRGKMGGVALVAVGAAGEIWCVTPFAKGG